LANLPFFLANSLPQAISKIQTRVRIAMRFNSVVVLACVAITAIAHYVQDGTGIQQGTLHWRNYFYVGGSFVQQGTSTLVHGQMYVEHLAPAKVTQPFPLVFIEGNGMTGTNLLNTPDGRRGWADYFMGKGYEVSSLLA
jgi:hypothetical protein